MAEQKETVIIEVEVDNEAAKKNAAQLTVELTKQRKELSELRKAFKNGDKSAEDFGQEASKLQREITKNSKSLRENQKAAEANSNSINGLRLSVSRLTQERNNLDTSTEEGREEFQRLTRVIKEQTDTLKELEGAVGDTRRNVGNYKEAVTEALNETDLFGGQIGELAGSFNSAIGFIRNFTKGLDGVRAALIATGLGAFIVLLGSLATFFTRSRRGAEELEKILGALGGVFNKVLNDISKFGEAIFDFVINPVDSAKEALSGLGDFVTDFFSDPAGTIEKAFEGVKDYAEALGDAAEAGRDAAAANIQSRKTIRELTSEQARFTFLAERARKQRDDERKSEQERLALNEEVLKFERARTEAQRRLNEERQNILQREIAERGGLVNATEEQLDQLAELERERFDILEDFEGRTTEVLTEGVSIQRDAALRRAEAIQAGADAELAAFEARNVALLESDRKVINDRLQLQIEAAEGAAVVARQQAENDIRNEEQRAAAIKQINAQLELEKAELRKAASEQIAEIDLGEIEKEREKAETELNIKRNQIEAELALEREGSQRRIELQRELIELERRQRLEEAKQRIEDERELQSQITLINAEAQQRREELETSASDNIAEAKETEAKATITAAQESAKAAREQGQSATEQARVVVNSIIEQVRARIREAIATQIAKVLTQVPFPANIALAGVAAGLTEALISRLIPGFASGGRIEGGTPIKRSNGDNVLITAKKGEVVLNKRQQSMLGGERTFRKIGVPGFATGGVVGGQAAGDSVRDSVQLEQSITNAIANMQPPVLDFREFTTFQRKVSLKESRAQS